MSAPEKNKDRTILIVEDDEAIRDTLRVAFELNGYQVFTAGNGMEGLDSLSRIPRPNVILLDLMMPVMDGWEFLDELAKDKTFAGIPTLVLTAFEAKSRAIPAVDVLKKPIDLDTLFKAIARHCA